VSSQRRMLDKGEGGAKKSVFSRTSWMDNPRILHVDSVKPNLYYDSNFRSKTDLKLLAYLSDLYIFGLTKKTSLHII